MTANPIKLCLGCGYDKLEPLIDLGYHPLANGLLKEQNQSSPVYPLAVNWCPWCSLLQLSHCVDRNEVFSLDYPFRSGVSEKWHDHCRQLAREWPADRWSAALMLDIGGNDGTATAAFHDSGWRGLVVDPIAKGEHAIPEFFTSLLARQWHEQWAKKPDLILAQNVLAHVEDPLDMLTGIATLLDDTGVAVIECPHMWTQMARRDFTQFYHEHVTYWSLRSLETCAARAGLAITNVRSLPDIHGGSIRYTLKKLPTLGEPSASVQGLRWNEQGPMTESRATAYSFRMQYELDLLKTRLTGSETIWAIGASAKLATLLSVVGPNSVAFVVDDTKEKQGKYLPTGQPILPPQDLSHVHRLLVGAWNWTDALKERARQLGFQGEFIVPF